MKLPFPNYVTIAANTFEGSLDMLTAVSADGSTYTVREGKFTNLLSDILGFKYKIQQTELLPSEDRGDGNFSGVIGVLQRGEADLGIDMIFQREDRRRIIDFSYPYYITDVTFLTNKPEPLPKNLAIIYPFSLAVWLLLAISLFIVAFLLYFQTKKQSFHRIFFEFLGSILEEGITLRFSLLSDRILVLAWVIGVMVLSYAYKGTLLAYMSFPPTKGVHDIDELTDAVLRDSYKCFNLVDVAFHKTLMQINIEKIRIIGKSLSENVGYDMDLFIRNTPSKPALIYIRPYLEPYRENLFLSHDSFLTLHMCIAVKRRFCCRRALDWAIRRIFESGLYDKFFRERRDFFLEYDIESMPTDIDDWNSLTLKDLTGAFTILVSGYSLAVLSLVLETIMGKFRTKTSGGFKNQTRFLRKRRNATKKRNGNNKYFR